MRRLNAAVARDRIIPRHFRPLGRFGGLGLEIRRELPAIARHSGQIPICGRLWICGNLSPGLVVSENSSHGSGRAVVVAQQPAQPLVAANVGADERAGPCRDQSVTEPLMVPLPVVMRYELVDRADQVPFPEQDQLVQTLLANRPHEPFRVSVGVRSLDWWRCDANEARLATSALLNDSRVAALGQAFRLQRR